VGGPLQVGRLREALAESAARGAELGLAWAE
jgi:hypothetical protein